MQIRCTFVVGLLVLSATATAADPLWQTHRLLEANGVVLTLEARSSCSLADSDWLRLTLTNTGKEPAQVQSVSCLMSHEAVESADGKPLQRGTLWRGDLRDIWPETLKTSPPSPLLLRPGDTHRAAERLSNTVAATLLLPPKTHARMDVNVQASLTLTGGAQAKTPPEGINFSFTWRHPNEEEFARAGRRLSQKLREGRAELGDAWVANRLLFVPDLARRVDAEDLLAGLTKQSEDSGWRNAITAYLNAHRNADPKVLAYYLDALRRADAAAMSDLGRCGQVWSDDFLQPLLAAVEDPESGEPQFSSALSVLSAHRSRWPAEDNLPRRLSATVLRRFPDAATKSVDLKDKDLSRWENAVKLLALTGDTSKAALLLPALDDRRVIHDYSATARQNAIYVLPIDALACDVAYNAIQVLRGRGQQCVTLFITVPTHRSEQEEAAAVKAERARRDKAIANLKAEVSRGER